MASSYSDDFTVYEVKTPNQSDWIDKTFWMEGEISSREKKKKVVQILLIQTFESYRDLGDHFAISTPISHTKNTIRFKYKCICVMPLKINFWVPGPLRNVQPSLSFFSRLLFHLLSSFMFTALYLWLHLPLSATRTDFSTYIYHKGLIRASCSAFNPTFIKMEFQLKWLERLVTFLYTSAICSTLTKTCFWKMQRGQRN